MHSTKTLTKRKNAGGKMGDDVVRSVVQWVFLWNGRGGQQCVLSSPPCSSPPLYKRVPDLLLSRLL